MNEENVMPRKMLIVLCSVLLFATATAAQSGGSRADPVSGTWKGTLDVPMSSDPVEVTLELKFDGKSKVSGTFTGLQRPGDVKIGTFNPATGALKLQLGRAGESAVLIILDGTLEKGVATGAVTGEGGDGKFKIAKQAA
jgi:hypothetical protein